MSDPTPVTVNVPLAMLVAPAATGFPTSPLVQPDVDPPAGGVGVGSGKPAVVPRTDTFWNVARAVAPSLLWLVTTRPTYTLDDIAIVSVLTTDHVLPSYE